jgi:hypothetical protein
MPRPGGRGYRQPAVEHAGHPQGQDQADPELGIVCVLASPAEDAAAALASLWLELGRPRSAELIFALHGANANPEAFEPKLNEVMDGLPWVTTTKTLFLAADASRRDWERVLAPALLTGTTVMVVVGTDSDVSVPWQLSQLVHAARIPIYLAARGTVRSSIRLLAPDRSAVFRAASHVTDVLESLRRRGSRPLPADFGDLLDLDPDSGHCVASPLLRVAFATVVREQPLRPYAAVADLLARRGHGNHARTLERLVRLWTGQRLWSLNLVPEMVAHDDLHAERVDGLVAQLAGPLLDESILNPDDMFLLSCAAWLHDWGHIGAELNGRYIEHPREVRFFHGLLSKRLLSTRFTAMHGLDEEAAAKVGALVSHHQGWTSFGAEEAGPGEESDLFLRYWQYRPPSLLEDAAEAGLDNTKARTLVALLRVADAADLRVQRIPEVWSRRDFLDFCVQRRALKVVQALVGSEHAGEAIRVATHVAEHPRDVDNAAALSAHPELQDLAAYVRFIRGQDKHYGRHRGIDHVRLSYPSPGVFQAHVVANSDADVETVGNVREVILRELNGPEEAGDRSVRDVLLDVGLRFDSNVVTERL